MFSAKKFCRIKQYNSLQHGEICSAPGRALCGSPFDRYINVLKEKTRISEPLKYRKIHFQNSKNNFSLENKINMSAEVFWQKVYKIKQINVMQLHL